jgi:hypothetical protein
MGEQTDWRVSEEKMERKRRGKGETTEKKKGKKRKEKPPYEIRCNGGEKGGQREQTTAGTEMLFVFPDNIRGKGNKKGDHWSGIVGSCPEPKFPSGRPRGYLEKEVVAFQGTNYVAQHVYRRGEYKG